METVDTSARLSSLRTLMQERKLDVYSQCHWFAKDRGTDLHTVVPSEDSHQSEYIAPCDARRGVIDKILVSSVQRS